MSKTCRLFKSGKDMIECAAMKFALGDVFENAERKGLVPIVTTRLTGQKIKRTHIGVSYKPSAKDPGVMLNRCPWCGGDLSIHLGHYLEKKDKP